MSGRYLNKHGQETLPNLINNLKDLTKKKLPTKVMVVGLGTMTFYSYDQLHAYIYAYEQLLKADGGEVEEKWP